MLLTIRTAITLLLLSFILLLGVFQIGRGYETLKAVNLAREPIHAVDFYPVDPEINKNLAIVRPYIQLCLQANRAWVWRIDSERGIALGGCAIGEGNNPLTEEFKSEANHHNENEVRSY